MATFFIPIHVNDLVKIDGQFVGRVVDIIKPLNSDNMFVVNTHTGTRQVPRYRLRVLPETVQMKITLT